jgi:hypothetical protein
MRIKFEIKTNKSPFCYFKERKEKWNERKDEFFIEATSRLWLQHTPPYKKSLVEMILIVRRKATFEGQRKPYVLQKHDDLPHLLMHVAHAPSTFLFSFTAVIGLREKEPKICTSFKFNPQSFNCFKSI